MNLKIWLVTQDKTLTQFCKEINHDITYLSKICKGKLRPGRKLAKQIEEATNGAVKAWDLRMGKINE